MRSTQPPIPVGSLARLVSPHTGVDRVVLGGIDDHDQQDDPSVEVGSLCVVCGEYASEHITSATAHIVLLEVGGRPQQFWVYRDELAVL